MGGDLRFLRANGLRTAWYAGRWLEARALSVYDSRFAVRSWLCPVWVPWAVAAAILYGLHNVFTRLASGKIDDLLGGLILEGTATTGIALYILWVKWRGGALIASTSG